MSRFFVALVVLAITSTYATADQAYPGEKEAPALKKLWKQIASGDGIKLYYAADDTSYYLNRPQLYAQTYLKLVRFGVDDEPMRTDYEVVHYNCSVKNYPNFEVAQYWSYVPYDKMPTDMGSMEGHEIPIPTKQMAIILSKICVIAADDRARKQAIVDKEATRTSNLSQTSGILPNPPVGCSSGSECALSGKAENQFSMPR